jgi:hypothetical protein
LSFALSLVAVVSLVIFMASSVGSLQLEVRPVLVRIFKHRRTTLNIKVGPGRGQWFGLSSARVKSGRVLDVEPVEVVYNGGSFRLSSPFAGRHEGLQLEVVTMDVLGLFQKESQVSLGFLAEVLPLSLLAPSPRLVVTGVTSGEITGGSRGSGQEFYGIEDYNTLTEVRDIIWKRAARSPDERLFARIRESEIPGTLRVALVEGTPEDRIAWMDLSSEAFGQIGVALLQIGMRLETSRQSSAGAVENQVEDTDELADAAVRLWDDSRAKPEQSVDLMEQDLLIIEPNALVDQKVRSAASAIPTILIERRRREPAGADDTFVFSGEEDLGEFLSRVVSR